MVADGFTLRSARPEDFPAFARIYSQAIASGRATMDTKPAEAADFEAWHARMSPREGFLTGELEGRVVAWGVVKLYSDRPGYAPACETSLYVDEAAQGRGVGHGMLPALLERARAANFHHVVAKVVAANEASVRFHERFGFEVVGVQREIGILDGARQDVVILQHLLR